MANAPSVQQDDVRRKDMTIELGKIGNPYKMRLAVFRSVKNHRNG
jgi:hypothetical protein